MPIFQGYCEASQYQMQTKVIDLNCLHFDLDCEAPHSKVSIQANLPYFLERLPKITQIFAPMFTIAAQVQWHILTVFKLHCEASHSKKGGILAKLPRHFIFDCEASHFGMMMSLFNTQIVTQMPFNDRK